MSRNSRSKRYSVPVVVPQEPIVPFVEVERVSFAKYNVSLRLIEGHPLKHRGKTYHWSSYDDTLSGHMYGRARSERFAKAVLSKYMRQIGYRSEDVKRYVGKMD